MNIAESFICKMNKPLVACALCLSLGSAAIAGVPKSVSKYEGKWIKVNENWLIDTEDVHMKKDRIRFWVERVATGEEISDAYDSYSWVGKYRIRCGDFHSLIETDDSYGGWKKIKPGDFAYRLASNFCYLTGVEGYTPEPIKYVWQRKITELLKSK